jgi:hypothetical protein
MYDAIMRVSGLVRELESVGMRVVIGDDFSEYRILRSTLSNRPPMYPMFDISKSYIDASNGFWICGFGPNNELIHTQAVRLLDLSGVSLAEHLDVHRHKYITPDTTPDPDLTYYSGPVALDSITGRVCYHGDFWLQASGLGGIRGQGVTGALVRTLFEVIQLNWMPDYVFALVAQPVAEKGAYLRAGYTHCEPGNWIGPDEQVTDIDFMVWMSAKDLANTLAREPQSVRNAESVSALRSKLTAIEAKG